MTQTLSLSFRVLLAGALFVRLAGAGREWLPSAPVLAGALVAWFALAALRREGVRGWRARAGLDGFAIALIVLMALTVLVRIPSIDTDLGRQPPDIDGHRLGASVKHFFVTGGIKYDTVEHYPGVVFWAITASSLISYLSGIMTGAFQSVRTMPVESFMLAARLTNIGAAVLTVGVTGLIGRRLGGSGAGLIAAGLLAFVPLAVGTSTETRNDPGQVLLLVATVWAALVAYTDRDPRWAVAAGALAGLASGVKYTSVFALVPVMFSVLAEETAAERLRRACLVLAAFAVALGISNHFLWWDFANFVRQLSDQVLITGEGHWAATDNPAAMHRDVLARSGPGWPLLVLGAGWGAWVLATGRPRAWLFWSFPLLYSWFTTHRPSQFDRWVYPLLPFVAIAGACGLMAVAGWVARWRHWSRSPRMRALEPVAVALVFALALALPLRASAVAISRRITPSTGMVLERWLQQSVPSGDVVLLEQGWLDLRDAAFSVLRVPDLEWALGPGEYALSAADWIVVPETHYSNTALGRLVLLKTVEAEQRSFGGNLGYDYRVYVPPRLAPVQRVDLNLDDESVQPMLGWEWDRRAGGSPGRLLPDRGARLFVPPLAPREVTIALDVANAGTAAQAAPLSVTIAGQRVALSDAATEDPKVRKLTGRLRVPPRSRAIEVHLDPIRHGARLRILRVQLL